MGLYIHSYSKVELVKDSTFDKENYDTNQFIYIPDLTPQNEVFSGRADDIKGDSFYTFDQHFHE